MRTTWFMVVAGKYRREKDGFVLECNRHEKKWWWICWKEEEFYASGTKRTRRKKK